MLFRSLWCDLSKKLSIIDFGWSSVKNYPQIFTPTCLGNISQFYGYIDHKQTRSDNYAAAIILSILIKNRSLVKVEEVIKELIVDAVSKNKSELKYFLLSIQNLQESFSNLQINNKNLTIDYSTNKDINVSDFLNSTSWKITKPLRYISRKYKKTTKVAKKFIDKLKTFKKRYL